MYSERGFENVYQAPPGVIAERILAKRGGGGKRGCFIPKRGTKAQRAAWREKRRALEKGRKST